jgi:adenylate cyclase
LPGPCPGCGAALSSGVRFCEECGAAVAVPGPPAATVTAAGGEFGAAGERKQVSVLFADVVGSMVLAERLDPERLRAVMAELTRRCAECVTRFDGMTLLCRVKSPVASGGVLALPRHGGVDLGVLG